MAIVIPGKSTCCLWEELIEEPYTTTSGCAFPQGHRLWKYCDAAMHLDCLERWPDREEFSLAYFQNECQHHKMMARNILGEGHGWLLVCGPHRRSDLTSFKFVGKITSSNMPEIPVYVRILLPYWPIHLYSKWDDWTEYVNSAYEEDLTGLALEAARKVIFEVRKVAPDKEALVRRLETVCGWE